MICPKCGKVARATATRYGVRHSCCDLWSWHGKTLTDAQTHHARKIAHDCFDLIWKKRLTSRTNAYKLLAKELNLTAAQCHMSIMDYDTAKRVPEAAYSIAERLLRDKVSNPARRQ